MSLDRRRGAYRLRRRHRPIGAPRFGTELAPAALLDAGLLDAVGGTDGGILDVRLVGADPRRRRPAWSVA